MANDDPESVAEPEWFAPRERFGADYDKILLDQYKTYVDTSTKVSERRATAQTFFLTANTLLATVYGLAPAEARSAASVDAWRWLVPLAGVLLALSWFVLIRSYSTLNSGKFQVIGEIEKRLPARLFDLEWHLLKRGRSRAHVRLTLVEQLIPLIFAGLFLVLGMKAVGVL